MKEPYGIISSSFIDFQECLDTISPFPTISGHLKPLANNYRYLYMSGRLC